MSDEHVFQASGEACPTCAALDGQVVTAGYQPHEGCTCSTAPSRTQGGCEYHEEGFEISMDGHYNAASLEVTVICPDGQEVGLSIEVDTHAATDALEWFDLIEGAALDAAESLCDDCPEPEPFLCC